MNKFNKKLLNSLVKTKNIIRYSTVSNITGEHSIRVLIFLDWDGLFDVLNNTININTACMVYHDKFDDIEKLLKYNIITDEDVPTKLEIKKDFIDQLYNLIIDCQKISEKTL